MSEAMSHWRVVVELPDLTQSLVAAMARRPADDTMEVFKVMGPFRGRRPIGIWRVTPRFRWEREG